MGLQTAARGHVCKLSIQFKNNILLYAVR